MIPNIFRKMNLATSGYYYYYYYRLELGNIQFENTVWDTYI